MISSVQSSPAVKMNCRFIIFLGFASFMVQAYASPAFEDEAVLLGDEPSGDSLLDKLEKLVEDAVNKATQKLKDLAKSFYNEVKSITEAAKDKLSKQLSGLQNEVEELKKEAEALGVNVTDCLKGREDALKNLPQKYIERNVNCSKYAITQGETIINNTKDQVQDKFQEVKDLREEFSACGSGVSSLSCKAVVIYKIQKTIAFLPVKILEIAADAVPEVWSLNSGLTKCMFNNNQAFYEEGKHIVVEISDCIKSKANSSQNSTVVPGSTTESPSRTTENY